MSETTIKMIMGALIAPPKKKTNVLPWLAPLTGILSGYGVWRFLIGSAANFTKPDLSGGFWPSHEGPKWGFARIYQGGIIVPLLIGAFVTVLIFVVDRLLAVRRATGKRRIEPFFHDLRYLLASGSIDTAIRECDIQKGSIGKVLKAGLFKYKDMIKADMDRDQKVLAIQKEMDEAASLELHSMEKNLVFLSTIASVATLMGLLGTVIGMITSFAALGDSGGGEAAQRLSQGISEALYNTAFGIGTSAISIIMYNVFTTRIDGITYGIDEGGYLLTQSFKSTYKA